jgi:hypothetical protein
LESTKRIKKSARPQPTAKEVSMNAEDKAKAEKLMRELKKKKLREQKTEIIKQ